VSHASQTNTDQTNSDQTHPSTDNHRPVHFRAWLPSRHAVGPAWEGGDLHATISGIGLQYSLWYATSLWEDGCNAYCIHLPAGTKLPRKEEEEQRELEQQLQPS
jgi:hypothetical protein